MHFESHFGVGWLIGSVAPGSDRSVRNWCVAAAIFPDVDAVSFLFGAEAYSHWHHTFGHNVFVGAALSGSALWHQRTRGVGRAALVALLVALCFASHLLTDAKLSAYALKPLWPLSHAEYEFTPNLGLASPINTYLVWASLATVVLLALWRRVTPLNIFSPQLDRIVVNAASPSRLHCHICSKPCSQRCDSCGGATCVHHAQVRRSLAIRCATCSAAAAARAALSIDEP